MIQLVFFLGVISHAAAVGYLKSPEKVATADIGATVPENECKIINSSDAGEMLICTSANGYITALDPTTLEEYWKHGGSDDGSISCETGIAFSPKTNSIVYGTTGADACMVHVLAASKELEVKAATFTPLDGRCSGTPVISDSGKYIFLTHNKERSGTFTILDLVEDNKIEILFQETDENEPFSPPGIFHNPEYGNYGTPEDGGLSNSNDIVVWANRPYEGEEGVGEAASYAFQFPLIFDGTATGLSVTELLRARDPWKTVVPPTLINNGLQMYWGVTKSNIFGWTLEDNRDKFNRGANKKVGFNRGRPSWKPISARVATTSSLEEPIIFTGTASNEFHAMSAQLDHKWNVTLTKEVTNQAQVSPDDKVVYFVDSVGFGYAYTVEGDKIWSEVPIATDGVTAGYTLSVDGSHIYYVSTGGKVSSWRTYASATDAPSLAPITPTVAPVTAAPIDSPTNAPVETNPPTYPPTDGDKSTSAASKGAIATREAIIIISAILYLVM